MKTINNLEDINNLTDSQKIRRVMDYCGMKEVKKKKKKGYAHSLDEFNQFLLTGGYEQLGEL